MNIVDILIIIVLAIYVIKGFKDGALKELVSFIGGLLVIIIAFLLKNPVSVFLYTHLPFMKFGGVLSGISVLNILIYEIMAFLIVAAVLLIIYRLILKVTNIVETILKITIILEIPSKIIGMIIGLLEGLVITFVILFVLQQFDASRKFIVDSKIGNAILTSTPILSNTTSSIYSSFDEIYTTAEKYKDSSDRDAANLEALDILLKYNVLSPENANTLVEDGKLDINGSSDIIKKYQ